MQYCRFPGKAVNLLVYLIFVLLITCFPLDFYFFFTKVLISCSDFKVNVGMLEPYIALFVAFLDY